MVSGRAASHSQGLCFPNTTPERQEIRECHSSSLMIKGRISLRPEAGRQESDIGKVGQEGNGGRIKEPRRGLQCISEGSHLVL